MAENLGILREPGKNISKIECQILQALQDVIYVSYEGPNNEVFQGALLKTNSGRAPHGIEPSGGFEKKLLENNPRDYAVEGYPSITQRHTYFQNLPKKKLHTQKSLTLESGEVVAVVRGRGRPKKNDGNSSQARPPRICAICNKPQITCPHRGPGRPRKSEVRAEIVDARGRKADRGERSPRKSKPQCLKVKLKAIHKRGPGRPKNETTSSETTTHRRKTKPSVRYESDQKEDSSEKTTAIKPPIEVEKTSNKKGDEGSKILKVINNLIVNPEKSSTEKRGRGRPPKNLTGSSNTEETQKPKREGQDKGNHGSNVTKIMKPDILKMMKKSMAIQKPKNKELGVTVKRGRGRPRKLPEVTQKTAPKVKNSTNPPTAIIVRNGNAPSKKPPVSIDSSVESSEVVKRGRGRPKKVQPPVVDINPVVVVELKTEAVEEQDQQIPEANHGGDDNVITLDPFELEVSKQENMYFEKYEEDEHGNLVKICEEIVPPDHEYWQDIPNGGEAFSITS